MRSKSSQKKLQVTSTKSRGNVMLADEDFKGYGEDVNDTY
jgi:hypothetical protein